MKTETIRYFSVSDSAIIERIIWYSKGANGVESEDKRCVEIGVMFDLSPGKSMDSWLPVSISNPAFDSSALMPIYETKAKIFIDPETGIASEIEVPNSVISVPNGIHPYNLPLLPEYTEITISEYNVIMT